MMRTLQKSQEVIGNETDVYNYANFLFDKVLDLVREGAEPNPGAAGDKFIPTNKGTEQFEKDISDVVEQAMGNLITVGGQDIADHCKEAIRKHLPEYIAELKQYVEKLKDFEKFSPITRNSWIGQVVGAIALPLIYIGLVYWVTKDMEPSPEPRPPGMYALDALFLTALVLLGRVVGGLSSIGYSYVKLDKKESKLREDDINQIYAKKDRIVRNIVNTYVALKNNFT